MPSQRITKDMVVDTAFELMREGGMEKVLVKEIAGKLGCSVQPIYSYCHSMDGLKRDLIDRSAEFVRNYIFTHIDKDDFFRSTGMAHIQLAKEEPYLFKAYFLRGRDNISSLSDIYSKETNPEVAGFISNKLDIGNETARELHLNMLIYTMGIAVILSTASPGIPAEELNIQLDGAYEAFLAQALTTGNKGAVK